MSEQQSSSEAKAQELFDQGKLAFNKGEYESSVTKLGEACQLLQVSHNWEKQCPCQLIHPIQGPAQRWSSTC